MRNETDDTQYACEDGKRRTVVSAKTEGKRFICGLDGRIIFEEISYNVILIKCLKKFKKS
jgi:hypothetical protein